jgi:nucleotide-binding universal stress UspA family protein
VLVSSKGVQAAAAQESEETLERWRAEAERRTGASVGTAVRSGDPAAEIVKYASEQRCDVVIVATRGRTGLTRMLLGSVAERVVRHADCPVLVARDRGAADLPP